jgi:arylsulfatase A-like enzyme
MTDKPNIVFFFTDDQRFNTIHALGNDVIKTPNIDALVERGTCFTHAHIPCGTSGAVCMPSRAMLNSGRKLFSLSGAGETIPEEHTIIGEMLQENGYRTFGTGKWHSGKETFNRCFSDGGEIFFGGMTDHWNVPAYDYDPEGKYDSFHPKCVDPGWSKETVNVACDHITAGKHSSEMVCDAALDFLGNYDVDNPFYMYISFLAPHDPRVMPQRFKDMYKAEDMELPQNFLGGHPFDTGNLKIRDEMLAPFPRDPDNTKEHIADYYAMISHLDYQLGRVVESLKAKGLYDNTIIIFAGDNGLALGQHGLFGKQSCYEHSVRVPLIFAGPGIKKNKKTDAYAYLFDIFPTVCDLIGAEIPASVEGTSLKKAIDGDDKVRDSLYFAYVHMHRAVKVGEYKLIEYVVDGKHNMTQLFNVERDPLEMCNLASSPEYAAKLNELREKLKSMRVEWGDVDTKFSKPFWDVYLKEV